MPAGIDHAKVKALTLDLQAESCGTGLLIIPQFYSPLG